MKWIQPLCLVSVLNVPSLFAAPETNDQLCTNVIKGVRAKESERVSMKAVGYFESKAIQEPGALLDLKIEAPQLAPKDLLVRVKAISVNPVDTKQRRRKSAEGKTPVVLGWDVSGVVEQVGPEATGFKVGDEVYYAGSILRDGGNAELHAVDSRIVSLKPKQMSHEEAAAIPLTALTAYEGLFEQLGVDRGGRDRGKTVLVIGGAGGVGSMVIQLAKLAGLKVLTTGSREESVSWSKDLGADEVLDYRKDLVEQARALGVQNVDFIFNTVSTETYWNAMAEIIRPFGRIVSIVEASGPLDLTLLMKKSVSFSWELMFTRSMFETPDLSEQKRILSEVANWLDAGQIKGTLNQTLTPINALNLMKAHSLLESGRSIGKIVLSGW